jgi:hypothetical protein
LWKNCIWFYSLGYDLGDVSYGMSNANSAAFPSDTYLSSANMDSVQTYVRILIGIVSLGMHVFLF